MGKTISFEEKRSCLMFYAIGALLHLAFMVGLFMYLLEILTIDFDKGDDMIPTVVRVVFVVVALACCLIILGERRYYKDRNIRAPFTFMLVPQVILLVISIVILIDPEIMYLGYGKALMILAIAVMVLMLILSIAKIVTGIVLITKKRIVFGLLLLVTGACFLVVIAIMAASIIDRLSSFDLNDVLGNFGIATVIYFALTTIETVAALIMFLTNKCCCKGKCNVEAPAYVAEQPTAAPEVEEIPESPKDITTE
ncbi:MAG: hypothetical protein IK092_04555 [Muribaculaceae bacterium]|nr:hypothetical protein [Muribaculaceae bacterium]